MPGKLFPTGLHSLTEVCWDNVLLCSLSWPRTSYADQAGPKFRDLLTSASWVLALKSCTTMPGLAIWVFVCYSSSCVWVSGLQINSRSILPYFKVLRLPLLLAVSFNAHHTKALTTQDQFRDYQCVTSTEAPGEGNSLRVSACSNYLITLRMSGSHRATQIFISAVKSL